MSAELIIKLIEAGTPPALVAEVAMELGRAQASQELLEQRRAKDRDRKRVPRNSTEPTEFQRAVSPKERNQTPSGTVLPNEAIASLPIRHPVSEAFKVWNENAAVAGWPQAKTMPPNRQKLVASRLREHGIAGWVGAIAKARASPYLSGADPPTWFTFSWLIKSENFLKLIEGNYDRRHNDSADPTTTALNRFLASAGG